jgi:hypothetical protein
LSCQKAVDLREITSVMASNDGPSNVSKWLFLAGIGLVIWLAGCKKHEVTEQSSETAPTAAPAPATPELARTVPAAPAPAAATPAPAPVVQATPVPELAPPGVFYLVSAVSIETSDGILGLKPGQPLREIRPGVYRADANEVTLRPEQVTNDMGRARQLMTQDQANQAALRQRLAAPAPVPVASTSATGRPQPGVPTAAPVAAPQLDEKNALRADLSRQTEEIDRQLQQLSLTMNGFANKYGGQMLAAKRSPQAALIYNQITALQKERIDLQARLGAIH